MAGSCRRFQVSVGGCFFSWRVYFYFLMQVGYFFDVFMFLSVSHRFWGAVPAIINEFSWKRRPCLTEKHDSWRNMTGTCGSSVCRQGIRHSSANIWRSKVGLDCSVLQFRTVPCQVGWGADFEDAPKNMDDLRRRLNGAKAGSFQIFQTQQAVYAGALQIVRSWFVMESDWLSCAQGGNFGACWWGHIKCRAGVLSSAWSIQWCSLEDSLRLQAGFLALSCQIHTEAWHFTSMLHALRSGQ